MWSDISRQRRLLKMRSTNQFNRRNEVIHYDQNEMQDDRQGVTGVSTYKFGVANAIQFGGTTRKKDAKKEGLLKPQKHRHICVNKTRTRNDILDRPIPINRISDNH